MFGTASPQITKGELKFHRRGSSISISRSRSLMLNGLSYYVSADSVICSPYLTSDMKCGFLTMSGGLTEHLSSNVSTRLFFPSVSPSDIFSGVSGGLEGKCIVRAPIQSRPCKWCHVPLVPQPSQPEVESSPGLLNPPCTPTILWSTDTSEPVWLPVNDWSRNALMSIVLKRTAIIAHTTYLSGYGHVRVRVAEGAVMYMIFSAS